MMFLLGLICGLWICSLIALLIEVRESPVIDDCEMPVIRPHWGDIE